MTDGEVPYFREVCTGPRLPCGSAFGSSRTVLLEPRATVETDALEFRHSVLDHEAWRQVRMLGLQFIVDRVHTGRECS